MRHARGFSMFEVMSAVVVIGIAAAAAGTSLSDRARRLQAAEDARKVFYPHGIARDTAAATRTCVAVEQRTDLVVTGRPGLHPGIRMTRWANCDPHDNTIVQTTDFPFVGDISFTVPYTVPVVFGPDGTLTRVTPSTAGAGTGHGCSFSGNGTSPPLGGNGFATGGATNRSGNSGSDSGSGAGVQNCSIQPPDRPPPPAVDINFEISTFYGDKYPYRIYSRSGATELLHN
jgi:prepilin-type N-terminal cleavage/methylation domain-containing protein